MVLISTLLAVNAHASNETGGVLGFNQQTAIYTDEGLQAKGAGFGGGIVDKNTFINKYGKFMFNGANTGLTETSQESGMIQIIDTPNKFATNDIKSPKTQAELLAQYIKEHGGNNMVWYKTAEAAVEADAIYLSEDSSDEDLNAVVQAAQVKWIGYTNNVQAEPHKVFATSNYANVIQKFRAPISFLDTAMPELSQAIDLSKEQATWIPLHE
jgi:hypothetical protein